MTVYRRDRGGGGGRRVKGFRGKKKPPPGPRGGLWPSGAGKADRHDDGMGAAWKASFGALIPAAVAAMAADSHTHASLFYE